MEEVGTAVSKVCKGDHVVLSWKRNCGICSTDDPVTCMQEITGGPGAHYAFAALANGEAVGSVLALG